MNGLPIAEELVADAVHGQFCPKMCTFACPVAAATGRDDAVPWSFHREVADLAQGRATAAKVRHRLDLCNGCLACADACTYDQDVPAQVVAARAAVLDAWTASPEVHAAVTKVAAGTSPYDVERVAGEPGDPEATTVLLVGCQDTAEQVAAVRAIAAAADVPLRVAVPEGCCGGVLRDLGATPAADAAAAITATQLQGAEVVVALDTGCLSEAGPDAIDVVHWLDRLLHDGGLHFKGAVGRVAWHDPAHIARRLDGVDATRRVLQALGAVLVDVEGSGRRTVSAGPGMGMELLDPEAAAATAARRAAQLRAADAPVLTVGSGVIGALRSAGLEVRDLVEVVAAHLSD